MEESTYKYKNYDPKINQRITMIENCIRHHYNWKYHQNDIKLEKKMDKICNSVCFYTETILKISIA